MSAVDQRSMRILLVDDNPGDVLLTKEAFGSCETEIDMIVADNGEQALKILRQEGEYADQPTPDLALFDVNIPKISGIELLKIVKEDNVLKCMPVIMLSSAKSDQDVANCYRAYANAYIVKPGDMAKLVSIARSIEDFWLGAVKLPKLAQ